MKRAIAAHYAADSGELRPELNPQPSSPDETLVLVCVNCARVVVFGPDGWAHGQGSADCPMLVVAWPPPGSEDEDAADDAA